MWKHQANYVRRKQLNSQNTALTPFRFVAGEESSWQVVNGVPFAELIDGGSDGIC